MELGILGEGDVHHHSRETEDPDGPQASSTSWVRGAECGFGCGQHQAFVLRRELVLKDGEAEVNCDQDEFGDRDGKEDERPHEQNLSGHKPLKASMMILHWG